MHFKTIRVPKIFENLRKVAIFKKIEMSKTRKNERVLMQLYKPVKLKKIQKVNVEKNV